MNYRSIKDLNHHIATGLTKVPAGTDLIVGVPRSGLLAANLLALHLNLPFTDVEGYMNGKILQSGERMKDYIKPFEQYKKVFVFEDSVWSGKSVKEVKSKLIGLYPEKELTFAAVYVTPESAEKVDIYFDICPGPRIFEWNLMHHDILEHCCVDIDGVLCFDPTEEENDDGDRYDHFLCNAAPLYLPSKTIGCLVTNRLEKYREQTEGWLAKNNIKYKKLVMMDLPSKEARQKANNYGGHKAAAYLSNESWLFIESSIWQSQQIANISGKSVYCMDTREMVYPNGINHTKGRVRKLAKSFVNKIRSRLSNVLSVSKLKTA